MPSGHLQADPSENVTTPTFLPGATRVPGLPRLEYRATPEPARDRYGGRRRPHDRRLFRQVVLVGASRCRAPGSFLMPISRDTGIPPGMARISAARPQVRRP